MIALVGAADPTRVHTGTDTRAFSLLLGAAVATRPVRAALARLPGRSAATVAVLLATCIAAGWALVAVAGSTWLFRGGLFAHSLAAAGLIGLCGQAPGTPLARVLGWRPLRWCGRISYSLYLWHWPVFVLLSGRDGGVRAVLAGAASVGLAALSTHLVEDPIRFRARWARGRRGVAAFAAVMIALAVLWTALPGPAVPAVDPTRLG
jgi:peptidoglycan/LPS O-acetylase OafA/YrhL